MPNFQDKFLKKNTPKIDELIELDVKGAQRLTVKTNPGEISMQLLTLSTCHPFDTNPPQEEHGGMVIDMEKGNLTVLLAQDKENLSSFNKLVSASTLMASSK